MNCVCGVTNFASSVFHDWGNRFAVLRTRLFGNVDYSSIWGGDVGLVGMQFHDLGARCEVIVNAIPRFGEAMWGSRAFYPTIWGSDVRLLRMLFTFWAGDMTVLGMLFDDLGQLNIE